MEFGNTMNQWTYIKVQTTILFLILLNQVQEIQMRQKNWMEQREVALKQKVNSGGRSATGTINLLRSFSLYGWLHVYQTTRLVEIKADVNL